MENILITVEQKPKNYQLMFIELLKKDNYFLNLVLDLKKRSFIKNKDNIKDTTRYIKYSNNPGLGEFCKQYLYPFHQISKLESLINYLDTSLENDERFTELKEHYYKDLKGSCVMGAYLYVYTVPKNIRKHIPNKTSLFTMGYSNGELYKEYIQSAYMNILESFDIHILYECGYMD